MNNITNYNFESKIKEFEENNRWNLLDEQEWVFVLEKKPNLVSKFEEFKGWEKFGIFWNILIKNFPQFIDKCSVENLRDIYPNEWKRILEKQPQLASYLDVVISNPRFSSVDVRELAENCKNNYEARNVIEKSPHLNEELLVKPFKSRLLFISRDEQGRISTESEEIIRWSKPDGAWE